MAMLSSRKLIGDEVTDPTGEHLGKIEDLVFDVESGEVEYAVLSVGGVMGLGDKYFAVPLQAMQKKPHADALVLDIDKQRLENAPGFDKANWPTRPDPQFCDRVRQYYRTP
jgi:sporulation protein YlmC with PRC-barrel domain